MSENTDHGTAGPVFVAGTPVKGGFYGDEQSLTDLDDGDLKTTVGFRDIYFEILTRTLADPRFRPAEGGLSDGLTSPTGDVAQSAASIPRPATALTSILTATAWRANRAQALR